MPARIWGANAREPGLENDFSAVGHRQENRRKERMYLFEEIAEKKFTHLGGIATCEYIFQ